MVEYLTIFGAGFIAVFAQGFQSRNTNNGDYRWAAGTSVVLGLVQATLWKEVTHEAGLLGGLIFGIAGAFGVTSSMYVHRRFIAHG